MASIGDGEKIIVGKKAVRSQIDPKCGLLMIQSRLGSGVRGKGCGPRREQACYVLQDKFFQNTLR